MADSTLAALTAATAGTGGLYYGTQSGADRKFTMSAAGAVLAEAADAAAQVTALGVLPLAGGTLTGAIVINGGTVTDSTPLLTISQTWNDVNDAFSLLNIAVTNTASKAYSDTVWADVSTLFDFRADGVTKLALIPKGSENSTMLRFGGTDANHALLKDAQTAGGIIFRGSGGLVDFACIGRMGDGSTGVTVTHYNGNGRIGFNSTSNNMAGGNSSADAFFQRAAAAAIQMGLNSATPIDQLFKGPNGSGTNIAAGDLRIGPGQSTGNATPATVVLQGTAAGSSGSTTQTLVDVLTVVREGVVRITNIPTSSAGLSTGDIWSDGGTLKIV